MLHSFLCAQVTCFRRYYKERSHIAHDFTGTLRPQGPLIERFPNEHDMVHIALTLNDDDAFLCRMTLVISA